MTRRLLALLCLLPALALATPEYPAAIYDAETSGIKSPPFSQSDADQVGEEIEAIETELQPNFRSHGPRNFLLNGSVETWSAGTSSAPDSWTLSGTGAAVARQSDGQDGQYSAQITAGSAASKLAQDGVATISAAQNQRFRSRAMTVIARVKTSAVSACRLQIADGVGTSQSSYHTGGGGWELLSITRTLDASATKAAVELLNDATDSSTTCRYDSVVLVEGKFPWEAFFASEGLSGVIHINTTQTCTGANTTETDLFTFSLPANTLSANGKTLRITTAAVKAANTNTVTARVYFGATTIQSRANSQSGFVFPWQSVVVRAGASSQKALGVTGSGGTSVSTIYSTPAEDTTGAILIKVTGQNGTAAANDICGEFFMVEILN